MEALITLDFHFKTSHYNNSHKTNIDQSESKLKCYVIMTELLNFPSGNNGQFVVKTETAEVGFLKGNYSREIHGNSILILLTTLIQF